MIVPDLTHMEDAIALTATEPHEPLAEDVTVDIEVARETLLCVFDGHGGACSVFLSFPARRLLPQE